MKRLLPLLIILIYSSCAQTQNNKSTTVKKITFNEYVRSLNKVSLPFECAWAPDRFAQNSFKYDTAGFRKYRCVDASRPYGVIYYNQKKHSNYGPCKRRLLHSACTDLL